MTFDGLLRTFFDTKHALLRFLMLRGATAAEAEDVLQDVSLKLTTEMPGPVSQPRAYLFKMVANQFFLARRTDRRRARREEDWVDAHGDDEREIDPDVAADERLIHREHLDILRAALDRLPERTHWIFTRFRIEGRPQKEIAAELGISVSAVEKHLSRAYQAIASVRRLLDEDGDLPRHLTRNRGRL